MADLIKGIDVSTIQGKIDFRAVAATGVQFVICRCGVGNGGIDNLYRQNIANAKAAGLKVMAYHFIYPLPPLASQPLRDPKAQAQMHVNAAGGELAACDLEWPAPQDWAKWNCTAAQIVQWSIDYLEAYERLSGIRPIVYTYPYFAQAIKLPDWFGQKYKLWIASYQAGTPFIPKPWTDWVIWQNSGGTGPSAEHLPNGAPVDGDRAKDLSLWDASTPAEPDPVPAPDPALPADPAPVPVPDPTPPAPAPLPVVPVSAPPPYKPTGWLVVWQLLTGLFNKYLKK
jgi:GH25 family lysozyme M1 (1,4-beta-N-acetylmuramidase)